MPRPVHTTDVINKAARAVGTIVDAWTSADGAAALVRTADGNAYEITVRQARDTQHPGLKRKTQSRVADSLIGDHEA